ncbi:MAG: histidine kinase [Gammaproteobacteria bacterium]|nr:histidine kinase [Gammaproteobacteria bacterium]
MSETANEPNAIAKRWLEHATVQFWLLQFVGWSGWAVAGSIGWIYWRPDSPYIQVYAAAALVGAAISTVLRSIYRRIWTWPMAPRVALALLVSYVAGGVWQVAKTIIIAAHFPMPQTEQAMGWLGYLEGITSSFYIMVTWSGLYFGIKWYQMLQTESAKVLRISAMAHEAQLKMLRYQLNPHFLFNTLNAISTLTLERDTPRANAMVTKLSSFLRYSLDSDPMQKVTMEQELHALSLYLDIEKVRFGERLTLVVDVEDLARQGLIPSLLLQPLVENAIKYAIARNEQGGIITIDARVRGDRLCVSVKDDGPGIPGLTDGNISERGVGLRNTRDRLQEIYGHHQRLSMANDAAQGLVVSIEIPYETTRRTDPGNDV